MAIQNTTLLHLKTEVPPYPSEATVETKRTNDAAKAAKYNRPGLVDADVGIARAEDDDGVCEKLDEALEAFRAGDYRPYRELTKEELACATVEQRAALLFVAPQAKIGFWERMFGSTEAQIKVTAIKLLWTTPPEQRAALVYAIRTHERLPQLMKYMDDEFGSRALLSLLG